MEAMFVARAGRWCTVLRHNGVRHKRPVISLKPRGVLGTCEESSEWHDPEECVGLFATVAWHCVMIGESR